MSIRPYRDIVRRKSRKIRVGAVEVGGDAPITVQSMTNTPTADAAATIDQISALEEAGADIVRVSCPDEDSTAAFAEIVQRREGPARCRHPLPLPPRHRSGRRRARRACASIRAISATAQRVKEVVQAAKDHGCSMRIGVNAGSLEQHLLEKYGEPCPEAMVESALDHARILEEHDFREYKISVKASDVFLTAAAYQRSPKPPTRRCISASPKRARCARAR